MPNPPTMTRKDELEKVRKGLKEWEDKCLAPMLKESPERYETFITT